MLKLHALSDVKVISLRIVIVHKCKKKREKKSEQFTEIIYLCCAKANKEVGSQSESLCFPLVSLKNASRVMRDSRKKCHLIYLLQA